MVPQRPPRGAGTTLAQANTQTMCIAPSRTTTNSTVNYIEDRSAAHAAGVDGAGEGTRS
jgi:hypothetical protein